jgi:hypothetical protein
MKTCTKCGETKALTEFHKLRKDQPILRSHCKVCRKAEVSAYQRSNPEKMRQWDKTRKVRNPEKIKERARIWAAQARLADPEKYHVVSLNDQAKRARGAPVWDKELNDLVLVEAVSLCRLRGAATGFKWDVDHTVPILGKRVSGLHNAHNLQVVPRVYNLRKAGKLLDVPSGFVTTANP